MKKTVTSILVASTLAISSQAAVASGWKFFPVQTDDYQFAPQLSVVAGTMKPADGDSGSISGLELAINCPLVKAPNGVIRQQISITSYDENGVEIQSFELNPHYQIDVAQDVAFGFGPGFGYLTADGAGLDDSAITLQAGATLSYTMGQVVIGAEARYQLAVNDMKTSTGADVDLDNTRFMLKLGYRF